MDRRSPGEAKAFSNISLMGPPGSGKTTVGKILSQLLNMQHIDVDNDVLESQWGTTVGQKLTDVGESAFLELEADEVCKLNPTNSLISLSGSVPLVPRGMNHISKISLVIYLNTSFDTIMSRLAQMKVDRIVGCGRNSLHDVLQSRYDIYEANYNIRVPIKDATPQAIAEQIQTILNSVGTHYFSTRGKSTGTFQEVTSALLEEIPLLQTLPYPELCRRILEKLPTLPPGQLKSIITEAYSQFPPAVLPLNPLPNGRQFLLETFHGPTASFKDLSLQLLPLLMQTTDPERTKKMGLLVATSGDTGSAALFGFARQGGPIVVLYPANGVSPIQRLQMTASCPNALVLGIHGDFDWCQNLVKQLLSNQQEHFGTTFTFSSANSINAGRLVPQIAYSVQAYLQLLNSGRLQPGEKFDITFPTGNFGNIFGALFARRMGLPIRKIVCASNDNNVLWSFLSTGTYDLVDRAFHATLSPSIDILVSSNLERWLFLLYLDSGSNESEASRIVAELMNDLKVKRKFTVSAEVLARMRSEIECGWCSELDSLLTIKRIFKEQSRLIDPHTAVAQFVAEKFTEQPPMVVVSTAHWAKFPAALIEALASPSPNPALVPQHNALPLGEQLLRLQELLGQHYQLPESISSLLNLPIIHSTVLEASEGAIIAAIKAYLAQFQQ